MNRRDFLALSAATLGGAALSPGRLFGEPIAFDLVLRGGTLVDGLGGPPRRGDVAFLGDTIAALGDLGTATARRSLDVTGKFVVPGFVDLHSHSDFSLRECPTADSRIRQGITTEIAGNCGSSIAPVPAGGEGFADLPAYFGALEEKGIALNQALLVGQGNLRERALGAVDRPATAAELARMCGELEAALAAGAVGFSTGLEYVPGIYTPAAEIEALARVAARHGALYSTHMRNEVDGVLDAIDESVEIARRTGVRLQISHLKVVGRPFWPLQEEALHRIERARDAGIDVMADVYPYTAYSTGLSILLPGWAREGGAGPLVARLAEPAARARIRGEVATYVARDPGDFDLVVISGVGKQGPAGVVGKSIAAIARQRGVEPAECVLQLIAETRDETSFVGFGMSEENVARVLAHPLVAVGSDGYALRAEDNDAERPHPRSYGTCARVLARYCRDLGVLDLQTAVRKMTALPADRAGLSDRGRLLAGTRADVVVFDLAALADRATYEEPKLYPGGIERVFVNGLAVVEDGAPTGARPGRVLRRI